MNTHVICPKGYYEIVKELGILMGFDTEVAGIRSWGYKSSRHSSLEGPFPRDIDTS